MRDFLAERLLVKLLEWNIDEIVNERPLLQALASFKYNDYQQFSTGIRFIESLVRWLNQFDDLSERKVAYNFFKEELIFISNEQMSYLVSITFNEKINPILINKTAIDNGLDKNLVHKIINSDEYKLNLRKSLFIGLSDGSRIDQLRRYSGLDNEQVTTTHQISSEKVTDMLDELDVAVSKKCKFETVFLLDDFTASGKSYFRVDEGKGKILKFLVKVFGKDEEWNNLTDRNNIDIHIIFYLATEEAIEMLQSEISKWKLENSIPNQIKVYTIQLISSSVKSKVLLHTEFIKLAEKYFDSRVVNKHYKKGKHEKPYLGFNECALPLVLNHNTPNNSLPILWLPEDMNKKGLFPRITRHK
jgi:hypothetical protein